MSELKQADKKIRSWELRDAVLAAIGISLVLGGSIMISPNFPILVGIIIRVIEEVKGIKFPKTKINRVLKNLEKQEILSITREDDKVYVRIKNKYDGRVLKYSIKKLLDLKREKKKWTGKWYLVTFDVPEDQKNKREYLRGFLKEIGFYPYQKSVYIFPYECEEEVELVKKVVEGNKYINYIIAEKIEREVEIRRFFKV
ncbi:CRISPR-associated endonuclease Cas2 [Candidatus Roizmanbacteria bacterium]|nr:CRISPR-associated endonuclease Cas2 [Candidatus Roizmanbacteria bacterium]